MNISKKTFLTVLIEATIVGLLLIVFVSFVNTYLLEYIPNYSGNKLFIEAIFIAGLLFHLTFEYTGLNLIYAQNYCQL